MHIKSYFGFISYISHKLNFVHLQLYEFLIFAMENFQTFKVYKNTVDSGLQVHVPITLSGKEICTY